MSCGTEKVINLRDLKKRNGYKSFYIIAREQVGVSGETGKPIDNAIYTEYLQFEGEFNELKYDWTDDISKAARFKTSDEAISLYEFFVHHVNILDYDTDNVMIVYGCFMYQENDTDLDIKFTIYQLGDAAEYFEDKPNE